MGVRVLAGGTLFALTVVGLTGCGAASAKYPDGVTVTEIKQRLERAPGKGQFIPPAFPTQAPPPESSEK
jgi:hypothetical protein